MTRRPDSEDRREATSDPGQDPGAGALAERAYAHAGDEVARDLAVDVAKGLDAAEVEARLRQYGRNEFVDASHRHPAAMLLSQFTSPLILALMAAAIISGFVSEVRDTVVISVILVLNGVIGFVQEYRADKAMAALREMTVPQVLVRRGGASVQIPALDVVPGDVVILNAGDLVAADGRVIVSANLRVDEAALTGESVPVDKRVEALDDAALSLGDRVNMVYRGTAAVYGRGEFVATATGMKTELGKVASELAAAEDRQTPLQRQLDRVGVRLSIGAGVVCLGVLAVGLLRGEELREMFMTALALAVAAIPESLPAVVTLSLAIGARAMAKRRALVRSLPAVEGLGAVTTICTDKTGTLTQNEMTVTDVFADGDAWQVTGIGCMPEGEIQDETGAAVESYPAGLRELLVAAALCNDAEVEEGNGDAGQCQAIGDPTETALLTLAMKGEVSPTGLRDEMPRVGEQPFDSDSKRMATVHEVGGEHITYAKGAPEAMLDQCTRIVWRGVEEEYDGKLRQAVQDRVEGLAARGRRTLALARRAGDAGSGDELVGGLTLLGIVGLIDPARPEALAAIADCKSAGIRAVMITGDHRLTAQAIASDLGLIAEGDEVMDGQQLDALPEGGLAEHVEHVAVYARVSPQHKLDIVEALQAHGHVVAMTGDGVNDGPALKRADIGVAMGQSGTAVAREASEMVLADDNFATIVAAVREGRVIFDNLRRFLRFLLTTNLCEVLTIVFAMVVGWPVPLLALQILWVNLVTDGLPALALGVEPAEKDVMSRPPRPPNEGVLSGGLLRSVILGSLYMTALVTLAMRSGHDLAHQRTIAFTALAFAQMANCVAVRSDTRLIARVGFFTNRALVGAVALTVLAQLAVVYMPALQAIFRTVALSAADLWLCVGVSLLTFLGVEAEKLIARYWGQGRKQAAQLDGRDGQRAG